MLAENGKSGANMERQDKYIGLIVSDPNVMLGKPTIAGTRITVKLILELLSGGATVEEILIDYPHLTREGITGALAFAADALRSDRVYPLVKAS